MLKRSNPVSSTPRLDLPPLIPIGTHLRFDYISVCQWITKHNFLVALMALFAINTTKIQLYPDAINVFSCCKIGNSCKRLSLDPGKDSKLKRGPDFKIRRCCMKILLWFLVIVVILMFFNGIPRD